MWKHVHNGLTQFYGFGSLTCFSCYGMTDDHKELVYESLVCVIHAWCIAMNSH